jgi:hypothetical protein
VQADLRNTQNCATPKYLLVGNMSFFSLLENDQNSSIKTCRHQLNYSATTNPHGWQAPSEFKPTIIIIIISTILLLLLVVVVVVVVVVFLLLLLLLAVAIFSLNSVMFVEQLLGFTSKFYSLLGYSNKHQKSSNQRKTKFHNIYF